MIENKIQKYICLLDGCYFISEIEQEAYVHQIEEGDVHKIALLEADGELYCSIKRY